MSVQMHHVTKEAPPIHLTAAATHRIITWLSENPENKAIRLSVKETGCSGLSYVITPVPAPQTLDRIILVSDTYSLCIDPASLPFLQGMTIDYVKQGLNHKFVFKNPNQTGQCGCGESFTVD